MKNLHWLPLDAAQWLLRTSAMSSDVFAAYVRLRWHAWMAHTRDEPPCTIPADPDDLAQLSGLGARGWKQIGSKVRAQFTEDGDRLVDADLLVLWNQQREAYEKRAAAGAKGGKAKADRLASEKQSASDGVAMLQQEELEGVPPGLQPGGNPPAVGGARAALTGSRAATSNDESTAEPGPTPTDGGPALSAADAKQLQLNGEVRDFPLPEYRARLQERVDKFAAREPARWGEIVAAAEGAARLEMGDDAPEAVLRRYVHDYAAETVRIEKSWPTYEAWVAMERAKQRGEANDAAA